MLLLIGSSGCDKGSKTGAVEVKGKVTFKGSPVTGGKLTLTSKSKESFPIDLGVDGTFHYRDIPALLIGEVTVTVDTKNVKNTGDAFKTGGAGTGVGLGKLAKQDDSSASDLIKKTEGKRAVYVAIPEKYADPAKSGLVWTIKAGMNEKDFNLE